MTSNKKVIFIMFCLSVVINIILQIMFHPSVAGGADSISLASAIIGRAIAFLILPLVVLGILTVIVHFTKKPIRYKVYILWAFWLIFFAVSTWGYF